MKSIKLWHSHVLAHEIWLPYLGLLGFFFLTLFLVVFVFLFHCYIFGLCEIGHCIFFYLLGVISSSRRRSRVWHVSSSWLKLFFFFQFCHSLLGYLEIKIHSLFFFWQAFIFVQVIMIDFYFLIQSIYCCWFFYPFLSGQVYGWSHKFF